ncbi:hypothetical protein T440DRAFT_529223 [Plenodomus tracheiphilus IPT5]|uniref:Uncharacterized protein n=1 Tax=Plenodomus tracheiphilus IPT5 TaxID=1408161 RepID=A0A6A7B6N3_9PLEO|nr:hypothetical protein T440DRAFT_529223 [Plenodomus tracheiphilus IPT5]
MARETVGVETCVVSLFTGTGPSALLLPLPSPNHQVFVYPGCSNACKDILILLRPVPAILCQRLVSRLSRSTLILIAGPFLRKQAAQSTIYCRPISASNTTLSPLHAVQKLCSVLLNSSNSPFKSLGQRTPLLVYNGLSLPSNFHPPQLRYYLQVAPTRAAE